MSLSVLKNKREIKNSRRALVDKGVSGLQSKLRKLISAFSSSNYMEVGDELKSWDVLKTVDFIQQNASVDANILDLGCYASEVLISLHKGGFKSLTGVDLNENIKNMPHAESIRYVKSNFMSMPFDNGSFEVITSISVIEHGYDPERLFSEVSRVLRPGGYFVSSFDYWPSKINTDGIKFFDLDWLIFSENDVRSLLKTAEKYGLHPVGDLKFESEDPCIDCANRKYTFAWLALQKKSVQ